MLLTPRRSTAVSKPPRLPLNLPEPQAGFLVSELPERVFEAEHFRGWQFEPWQKLSGSNGIHPSQSLSTATRKAGQKAYFRSSHYARNAGISLSSK
jgi:hypothetical protein